MNTFHVGQHVVCIDDGNLDCIIKGVRFDMLSGLVLNKIYTIKKMEMRKSRYRGVSDVRLTLCLVEHDNPAKYIPDFKDSPTGFCSDRFRPLQTIKVEDFMKQEVDA